MSNCSTQVKVPLFKLRADVTTAEDEVRVGYEGEDVNTAGAGSRRRTGGRTTEYTQKHRGHEDRLRGSQLRYGGVGW